MYTTANNHRCHHNHRRIQRGPKANQHHTNRQSATTTTSNATSISNSNGTSISNWGPGSRRVSRTLFFFFKFLSILQMIFTDRLIITF